LRYKIVERSLKALADRYGINQNNFALWKKRELVADHTTGSSG
jgi:hypothetical protein